MGQAPCTIGGIHALNLRRNGIFQLYLDKRELPGYLTCHWMEENTMSDPTSRTRKTGKIAKSGKTIKLEMKDKTTSPISTGKKVRITVKRSPKITPAMAAASTEVFCQPKEGDSEVTPIDLSLKKDPSDAPYTNGGKLIRGSASLLAFKDAKCEQALFTSGNEAALSYAELSGTAPLKLYLKGG